MIAARTTLTSAVILLGACGRTQPVSRTKDSSVAHTDASTALVGRVTQGSFAFANSDGTQLLALDSLADPSTIRGAVCSGGIALTTRYDHRAAGQSGGNGRQIAANFANEQGDIFRVSGSKATSDQTCYLSA